MNCILFSLDVLNSLKIISFFHFYLSNVTGLHISYVKALLREYKICYNEYSSCYSPSADIAFFLLHAHEKT